MEHKFVKLQILNELYHFQKFKLRQKMEKKLHMIVVVWCWPTKFRVQMFFYLGEKNKRNLIAWILLQKWTVRIEGIGVR